ncbi:uncharacterized protein Tco025E_02617 [Trypanosoma conorhini]|uniref:RING-type domain-containing protein n=1 Tax=Trypanosoma conorhini TaxID=83891 RepID=A0A3S5IU02_9TRYP|nr:uncharacterized protein Tco025E_02617 [Trypanosoma conorhini]RNF24117.1 hypothetical protein Tco025E_02617 [Trypanosoma conorhini]
MLYDGSISIAPDPMQFDTNAIITTTPTSTSSPESLQVDIVDLVLAAIQNCRCDNPTYAGSREVNAVDFNSGGGGSVRRRGTEGEKLEMKRGTEGGKAGKENDYEETQSGTRGASRQALTFALMLCRRTSRRKRGSVRDKRQALSKGKQPPMESFVCVYSIANPMENASSPLSTTIAPTGPRGYDSLNPYESTNSNFYRDRYGEYSLSKMEELQSFSRQRPRGPPKSEHLTASIEDMRGTHGATMPVTLQYVRIGNDLYAVTEVSDRTFVQYREERVLLGRGGVDEPYPGVSGAATEGTTAAKRARRLSSYSIGAASYSLASSPQMGVRHQLVRMCWLCLRTEANIIILPCAHFLLCRACADTLSHCCICHRLIHATIELHDDTTGETEV